MKILVACEYSGIVRDAFGAKGHDATSCDLLPTESSGPHIQGDVLQLLDDDWDMMIAFPPCTYLLYVGNRHWNKPGRKEKREEALDFFKALYHAPIPRVCLENPMGWPHSVFKRASQRIEPYYFPTSGEFVKKRTYLWLRNLPPLVYKKPEREPEPTYYLKTTGKAIHHTETIHGSKKRSRFWIGIAEAMANQWPGKTLNDFRPMSK